MKTRQVFTTGERHTHLRRKNCSSHIYKQPLNPSPLYLLHLFSVCHHSLPLIPSLSDTHGGMCEIPSLCGQDLHNVMVSRKWRKPICMAFSRHSLNSLPLHHEANLCEFDHRAGLGNHGRRRCCAGKYEDQNGTNEDVDDGASTNIQHFFSLSPQAQKLTLIMSFTPPLSKTRGDREYKMQESMQ